MLKYIIEYMWCNKYIIIIFGN